MKLQIGGGFLSTLTIIFVIAKITGYVDWSWWLVFSPIIVGGIIALSVGIIILILMILGAIFS